MTVSSSLSSNPLGYLGLDYYTQPEFITAMRAPTVNDIQLPGTRWQNNSVNPPVMYVTPGRGIWNQEGNAAGSFSTVTATGNITTTGGNLVLSGAAKQIQIDGGAATDFIGTATLAAGTVTVANTNIAANDRIIPFRIAANASTTLGQLSYTISAGTSFTINSLILGTPGSVQTGDLSTVGYLIVRQL